MTLKDVYDTFPYGCTEDYKILRAFEMGKQTSDKKVRDLEAQIEKMKCCYNCKHSRTDYVHCITNKHEKWEMIEK